MDRIKNISQIMEIVRSQISDKSAALNKKNKSATSRSSSRQKAEKISQQQLRYRISSKLKNLNGEQDDIMRRSKVIFLESVFAWEFGDDLRNDPSFPKLIEKILLIMDKDKDTAQQFEQMIRQLLK